MDKMSKSVTPDEIPYAPPDFLMVWESFQGVRLACLRCSWISSSTVTKMSEANNISTEHSVNYH